MRETHAKCVRVEISAFPCKSGSPRQNSAETLFTRAGFERAIATRNQHTTYRRQSNTVGKNSAETVLAGFERAIATRKSQFNNSSVWNAFSSDGRYRYQSIDTSDSSVSFVGIDYSMPYCCKTIRYFACHVP